MGLDDSKSRKTKKREAFEHEKTLRQYNRKQIVELLSGELGMPKEKIAEFYDAFTDLLIEVSFTECVFHIPKFGKFVFQPTHNQKIWNPKEGKSLIYQNPKVSFKLSRKLRSLLRKQYRKNCYQLSDINKMKKEDFKPPQSKVKNEET